MNIQNVKRVSEEEQKVKDVEDKLDGSITAKELLSIIEEAFSEKDLIKSLFDSMGD